MRTLLTLALSLVLAASLQAADHNISITATGFSPAYLEVSVGDTVYWWNTDSLLHSSRSDVYPWNLGPINPGYGVYLDTRRAGVFEYVDDWGLATATLVIKAPVLSDPVALQGGYFMFTMNNLVMGETLNIETSSDLVSWRTLLTRVVTLVPDSFIDFESAGTFGPRFYRISVAP